MFRNILVPLDGSSRAERALPVAARLAQASGGTVVLLRVVRFSTEFVPYPEADPWTIRTINDADLAEARNYLEHITDMSSLSDVQTETTVIKGRAADTILSVVETYHIDLIMLCSHGYTGMKRWVLGSVAEKVARSAPIPVLVLREDGPAPASPHPDPTHPLRVLVTLDGSELAKAALEPAASLIAALATPAQGALHLVRVVKPVSPEKEEKDPEEREHFLIQGQTLPQFDGGASARRPGCPCCRGPQTPRHLVGCGRYRCGRGHRQSGRERGRCRRGRGVRWLRYHRYGDPWT
jgi:nucleotide-binding universal stress UspA family protein